MLYDLKIDWSPATTADDLHQTLVLAAELGYGTVALNHTLEPPFPAKPVAPFPPLPLAAKASPTAARMPALLRRATLPLADPNTSSYRLPSLAAAYDLLAIRPLTEKAFQNACLTLDVPLISLDMTAHFPFHFRPKPCMAAVGRGVRFEICYGQLLAADSRGRSNFIANLTGLVRATRGRGFVISSEAKSALSLRGPADIVNMLNLWGLARDKGLEGVRSVPRSIVVNERLKRTGFRGVVDVLQPATAPADAQSAPAAALQAAPSPDGKAPGQKRKLDGVSAEQAASSQPISKRQAKKQKLAALSSTGAAK